jgi:hypothetical protein
VILTNQELRSLEREAERLVHEAGAFRFIEELFESTQKREGRPRGLPVKALFVGMQILSFAGDYFLRDVPRVLNGLSADLRKRLGIHGTTITSRQVTYLVSRIDAVLRTNFTDDTMSEGERYANFDAVFSAVAVSGAHAETNNSLSISVDGSDIGTWASNRFTYKFLVDPATGVLEWTLVKKNTDTDAGRRASGAVDGKPALFGYELTAAVSVADVGGPEVPRTTLSARFRPTGQSDPRVATLACVEEVKVRRGQLGDVLIDRGYTQSKHGKDFLTPVRVLGGEPVFDLKDNQVGVSTTQFGAIVIDGRPYSPSIPKALRFIARPTAKGTQSYRPSPQEIATYELAISAREVYALVPHGRMDDHLKMKFQCPGAAGKLICPLQASFNKPQKVAMPAAQPPMRALPNSVCSSRYRTFNIAVDLPLYQRDIFGSTKWRKSYARRGTTVEPHFGRLKDEAAASYRRGKVRLRGIVKTGLMVAFALATTNRRLALSWEARKAQAIARQFKRRPKRDRFIHRLTSFTLQGNDVSLLLYPRRA